MNQKYANSDSTSQYKGVYWHKARNKWCASIRLFKKTKHLGSFNSEQEAADVYNCAAKMLFGNYAKSNIL